MTAVNPVNPAPVTNSSADSSATDRGATGTERRHWRFGVIGNPNTGKSTLFSALTGVHTRTGNYPGVTVEKKVGRLKLGDQICELIDLPGTYSLSPRSLDEMVTVDVLLARQADSEPLDGVICIVDASNLERNLYLLTQLLELRLPIVLVLNMLDLAAARGVTIDQAALAGRLGVKVVGCEAHRGANIEAVRTALAELATLPPSSVASPLPPAFQSAVDAWHGQLAMAPSWLGREFLRNRLVLDAGGSLEEAAVAEAGPQFAESLKQIREQLAAAGLRIPGFEARSRYAWIRQQLDGIVSAPRRHEQTRSDRIDAILTHRVFGVVIFIAVMLLIFLSLYQLSAPLVELLESLQSGISQAISAIIPPGPLRSLLTDGVLAGVGGVLVFVPQIAILFALIALLEDCGYMARAAFLMDRLMSRLGLSGKSFVPLLSSFACAVPGIMATRVIENRRDRFVTILVAPLMSCSARLPVYVLMIQAFVPDIRYGGGFIPLQGLVLFAATSLGAIVAIPIAWALKRWLFKGETPPFVMELPSYKWPSLWIVANRVVDRVWAFVKRAGTLIFATSVLIWALGYFPADHTEFHRLTGELEQLTATHAADLARQTEIASQLEALAADDPAHATLVTEQQELANRLAPLSTAIDRRNQLASQLLEQSVLGRLGHGLEPVVKPLGWDWRLGVAVVASFPAREVVIATLGTIYSLGSDVAEDDASLRNVLQSATWPDGRPVFSLAVALSVMVFFALCAQCASTLMIIRRETNTWRWPIFCFVYMTGLAYAGAWITVQVARWCGG